MRRASATCEPFAALPGAGYVRSPPIADIGALGLPLSQIAVAIERARVVKEEV
jgi:hypothetical protein